MKIKILALILSFLCLAAVFAGCDKPCETHVDDNNDGACDVCEAEVEIVKCEHVDKNSDKICDGCGKSVVVVVEQLPAETESAVDMVVNTIPADAVIGEYVNTNKPAQEFVSGSDKLSGDVAGAVGNYLLIKYTDEDGLTEYKLYDLSGNTKKELWSAKDTQTANRLTVYEAKLYENWYIIVTRSYDILTDEFGVIIDTPELFETKYDVFAYGAKGARIGVQVVSDDMNTVAFEEPIRIYADSRRECYLSFQDKVFVIDMETETVTYTFDEYKFVRRPEMDVVIGNLGYVFDSEIDPDLGTVDYNSVCVYNLDKWIDCVYSYTTPEKYENDGMFILQNGKILVTGDVRLADTAVSYDYLADGKKYDMVYTMIDAANKTETNVEFGYKIEMCMPIEEYMGMTEKAQNYNIMAVYAIVDGYVDSTPTPMYLVADNDLNIMTEVSFEATLVDNNRFLREVVFNYGNQLLGMNSIYAYELINEKGEHIEYISHDVECRVGYKVVGSKLYDYNNNVLIDFSEYEQVLSALENGGYTILKSLKEEVIEEETTSVTEYYRYVPGKAPVKIDNSKEDWKIESVNDFGYEISYTKTVTVVDELSGEESERKVTVYEYYNANGACVATADSKMVSYDGLENGNYVVITKGGEFIILK